MTEPAKLPSMKFEEVKASAQRVLDLRGRPPYGSSIGQSHPLYDEFGAGLTDDELRVISEFVQFWLPFLVEKEKK